MQAVKLLQQAGAQQLIHCGDIGNPQMLDALVGLPAAFVFGNTDHDRDELRNYATILGINCLNTYGVLNLAGKRIAVTHGDDPLLMGRLTRPGQPIDYLLTGHTHVRHDRKLGSVRSINPGALYRTPNKSVAILDLLKDELTYYAIPEE